MVIHVLGKEQGKNIEDVFGRLEWHVIDFASITHAYYFTTIVKAYYTSALVI